MMVAAFPALIRKILEESSYFSEPIIMDGIFGFLYLKTGTTIAYCRDKALPCLRAPQNESNESVFISHSPFIVNQ
jgi:hypothetical protein